MEMSDFDIYLDYKNAKRPEEQIKILAELNATTPEVIREVINKKIEEEQKKMTEEEKKAKKAAYMKKYWERKKLEKTAVPEEPKQEPITIPSDPRPDDSELIRKAVQYYAYELADAVTNQMEIVKEEQEKLRKMEEDLERCQKILGHKSKEAEDEEQID